MRSFLDIVVGRSLASEEEGEQKIGSFAGLPVLGLDALSSSAYGPEAAATVLIPLGALGVAQVLPISLAIIGLLAIVYFSYRQTIAAYPSGGGSYTVATENLGTFCGLLAAAALLLDYVLTVAVGISAGVGALISALPSLQPYVLPLCLATLALITLVNLRGLREAGMVFMVPTYLFIGSLLAILGYGLVQTFLAGGHPVAVARAAPVSMHATEALSLWLLLRAFASGCTAMTGVEAVSNGVKAFREPVVGNATRTLTMIIVLLAILLGGIAYLAKAYEIAAIPADAPGYQSLLSQLVAAIVGRGGIYYVTIGAVVAVLMLSANTGFADFPRMCQIIARDHFLPHIFAERGRRLVFTYGILCIAVIASLLLIIFDGVTDRLIPLYAIGAFMAFTLSQAGMVEHWRRARDQKHAHVSMAINGLGAVATGATLLVVLVSKFTEGGWITAILIPATIVFFYWVRRHYRDVAAALTTKQPLDFADRYSAMVIVPVRNWNRLTLKALNFALDISEDVLCVYIDNEEEPSCLKEDWATYVEAPARLAGRKAPELIQLPSPYRRLFGALLDHLTELEKRYPHRKMAVLIPSLVELRWYHYFLHNQRALLLQGAIRLRADPRIVTIMVPWYL